VGDEIASTSGNPVIITTIKGDASERDVYNLTINEDHSYAVGELGVWSHNVKGVKYPAAAQKVLREILKREKELLEDKHCIPEFGPGPNYTTRQGHRRIITYLWRVFYKKLDAHVKK